MLLRVKYIPDVEYLDHRAWTIDVTESSGVKEG
jgi:hypothetical protein